MKTLVIKDPQKLFFTSDTHFHHENIIKFCNRPFKDVRHMNRTMIDNWNSVVGSHDLVIHAGDFCWGDTQMWLYFLSQLNGIKILVKGNHDKIGTIPITKFQSVYQYLDLSVKDDNALGKIQKITVCHYPMLSWNQSHKGAWQLYGHWHNKKVQESPILPGNTKVSDYVKEEFLHMNNLRPNQYDVGVDGNDFTPISYEKIKKIILSQKNDLK